MAHKALSLLRILAFDMGGGVWLYLVTESGLARLFFGVCLMSIPRSVTHAAHECFRLYMTRAISECRTGDLHAYIDAPFESVTVDAPDGQWWIVPVPQSWRYM